MGSLLLSCGAGVILFAAGGSVAPHPSSAAASYQSGQQATVPSHRVFGSDAGLVLNFIKSDRTADFEVVMAKLKDALHKSKNPERQQQAKSWKVFRAIEPADKGSVLYLFVMDPAVPHADYTVSTILAEAFPDEVQELYKRYADSYATGQNFVNLTTVQALGVDTTSTK